ncbi:hypothetical protein ABLE93_11640 [Xanthobacter sp. KR7-65]|uniref:hypothetical protein n=1 Tax=Xanthobacter sp. KR7-65 TaxID=3156612 RepID=UPI0032B425B3
MAEAAVARPEAEHSWLDTARDPRTREVLLAHPDFPRALARLAAGMTGLYSGNRLLNRLLSDRGRNVFGLLLLYLDALPPAEGGGLTAARLAGLCTMTGLCSRGRAKAILALMRWGGYVAPAAPGDDRRIKPLVPQPRLYALQKSRWTVLFGAIGLIDPDMARVPARLDDDAFVRALVIVLAQSYCAGYRVISAAPVLDDLVDHDSALMVLLMLLASEGNGTAPPAIADLARRFHVSRAHVLHLLRLCEERGLVERGARGAGRLSPAGRDALAQFFAGIFALMAGAARAAEARLLAA